MAVYTLGVWTVKPGHEDEFVSAWTEMGNATMQAFPGATGTLLRDRDVPGRFISFGPWESMEQVEQWRGSPAFRDGVARIRATLDGFEPHTMDEVLTVR
ncbi:MAG TPA: antibiotic biosynthesis monooxygenase family protein [Streptosporangiales bacterium]